MNGLFKPDSQKPWTVTLRDWIDGHQSRHQHTEYPGGQGNPEGRHELAGIPHFLFPVTGIDIKTAADNQVPEHRWIVWIKNTLYGLDLVAGGLFLKIVKINLRSKQQDGIRYRHPLKFQFAQKFNDMHVISVGPLKFWSFKSDGCFSDSRLFVQLTHHRKNQRDSVYRWLPEWKMLKWNRTQSHFNYVWTGMLSYCTPQSTFLFYTFYILLSLLNRPIFFCSIK